MINYLVGVALVRKADNPPSQYIISVLDLNTGEIVESILKRYNEESFKQDIEFIAMDSYSSSKILFENEDRELTNFLRSNFEDWLYSSEIETIGRKSYGWRPNRSTQSSFRTSIPEVEEFKISVGSLLYFFDKSVGMV